jgi:DNA-dependent RNA polymerase auxiliary subunit epsilon
MLMRAIDFIYLQRAMCPLNIYIMSTNLSERDIDFSIPRNRYLQFGAGTWKNLFIDRMNQLGYYNQAGAEGSNLNIYADVMSLTFSSLMYQLNKTASSGQFSDTQLYTAMNKMVSELDYRPIGHQTPTVSFQASAVNLSAGLYQIPRYSYIRVGGYNYSFNEDIIFRKTVDTVSESLNTVSDTKLLYQGTWVEFPTKSATGADNEIVVLTVDDNVIVDHNNIHVYIRKDGVWKRWEEVQSLYLSGACDQHFEKRLNERKHYELKFGDDINGAKLDAGDEIAVYFLQSDGSAGDLGAGDLEAATFVVFDTVRHRRILADTLSTNTAPNVPSTGTVLTFNNTKGSTPYQVPETVDDIRKNAPSVFRSQYRLVTEGDYEAYVRSNFSSFIHDVKVMSNETFMDSYYRYYDELGISPEKANRFLFAQTRFGTSVNFNNVWMIMVPQTEGYLGVGQKSAIKQKLKQESCLTSNAIPFDPVYLSFDLAVQSESVMKITDREDSKLVFVKQNNSLRSSDSILEEATGVITEFFSKEKNMLGGVVNMAQLSTDLSQISGVGRVYTENTSTGSQTDGISMVRWNPVYPNDVRAVNGNLQLLDFQFPVLDPDKALISKLEVVDNSLNLTGIDA